MDGNSFALVTSFATVVLGLAILLGSEALGMSEVFVVVGGAVALAGVGILTAVVMCLPKEPGSEHDHA
ncbi:hypothetical protein GJR96_12185 [Haloferax sp. MBLA0076]|uniref:Uncharacterized protein n=1 Tax=Haloferax litoreum TaxID=2666140 RepID=A0A6A8GHU4_9EURY|nr:MULTISPECIES: hypothetical protein [Haloferax]KAB1194148.1 hypothetical protein Hfx1148_12125 [Haloferax sp. CBA1148]MRX22705.1 hypothetical protein [Haloferax litoreum]